MTKNSLNSSEAAGSAEPAAKFSSSKLLRNIKGIIFDFDGTLFDNVLLPFYLIRAFPPDILRIRKERLIRKSFSGCDYLSTDNYYQAFFTALGRACFRSPQRMQNWYFDRYMPRMIRVLKKHYKLRPGVTDLFSCFDVQKNSGCSAAGGKNGGLADGKAPGSPQQALPRVAVYSDYPYLKERLEALGLCPDPDIRLYGPESFGAQKPAARPFRTIARDLGVTPEEVLVIGDREDTDGLGASKAGMRFFCLETGRKRYFRLDPYRQIKDEEPHGPSLLMYAGTWDDLNKLLLEKYNLFARE